MFIQLTKYILAYILIYNFYSILSDYGFPVANFCSCLLPWPVLAIAYTIFFLCGNLGRSLRCGMSNWQNLHCVPLYAWNRRDPEIADINTFRPLLPPVRNSTGYSLCLSILYLGTCERHHTLPWLAIVEDGKSMNWYVSTIKYTSFLLIL